MKIKKDHLNFAVGPVMMDPLISAIGAEPVPYFRTPDFSQLMLENEALLKELMGAASDFRAVFLTGSGTASMDAAVCNIFTKEDRLLIVNGGGFGHRFCEIADVYRIPYTSIDLESGRCLKEEDLEPYRGENNTGFLINMHETSTGVLYDMELVGRFCKENGLLLVVDAISAFLADPLNAEEIGADAVLTGSQKALAVPPGVSMMVLSPKAVKRIDENEPPCYYLDLRSALKNGERGQTPFTPAVGILLQINARLNEIAAEGIEKERQKIKAVAEDFRSRIASYPFTVASESLSNALTPLSPKTPGVSAHEIFRILKEEYDIIVCPNGGALADKVFRVGHIGALTIDDNDRLFAALDDLLKRNLI